MIVAALCFYDEPVDFLNRCVRSLEGLCTHLVALDGRWQHMDGPDVSPVEQSDTIEQAAWGANIGGRVVTGTRVYHDQPAKRTRLLELAHEHRRDCPWVFIIDGDEWVTHLNPDLLHRRLSFTALDVCEIGYRITNPKHRNQQPERRPRRLIRNIGCQYHGAHNRLRTPDGRSLLLPMGQEHLQEQALDLTAALAIGHDQRMRPEGRTARQRRYYRIRSQLKLEKAAA